MVSLQRCMAVAVRVRQVKTDGAGFRASGANPMAGRLPGILRHQALEFGLGFLVLEMRLSGANKDAGEFRPGIGGAHVDDAHRLNARLRRLDPKQGWRLATFDTAPELPLGGDNEVLVERIGMGGDLDPFAAAGNH